MTLPRLPRLWATNTNYSSGPDSGSPTKVDPSSDADGFIKGVIAAPQHVNYLLGAVSAASRRSLAIAACSMREIRLDGTAISDTASSCGVVAIGEAFDVLAIKTAQALAIQDGYRFRVPGVPASITSLVTDAAYSPSLGRIVAIGTGGNRCTYSDTLGTSWSAGGNIGATPGYIVWNSVHSTFIVTQNSAIKYSSDATSWSTASSAAQTDAGLAILSNGDTFYTDALARISKSTDGGVTWGGPATVLASHASFDEPGTLVGCTGAYVYHCARLSSGTSLQISSSPDGASWGAVATFTPPAGHTYASLPRILCCKNTGTLWVAAPITNGTTSQTEVRACIGDPTAAQESWSDRFFAPAQNIAGFGAAGGRLVCSLGAQLFASDGVGWS